jgi:hypothetical protein
MNEWMNSHAPLKMQWSVLYFFCCFEYDLIFGVSAVQTANMSKGWSRHVKFNLFVLNQIDRRRSIVEGIFLLLYIVSFFNSLIWKDRSSGAGKTKV